MLLDEIAEFAARRHPEAVALDHDGGVVSFSELFDRIVRVAGWLAGYAAPGDRVAVLSENTSGFVDLYYAAPRAGMVLTPLNYRLHPEELAWMLGHSEAAVLVGEQALLDTVLPLRDRFPSVRTVAAFEEWNEVLQGPETEAASGRAAGDPAWLLYTSGTTGRPKGAVLTHRSLLAAVTATLLARPVTPDDAYLFPFPLCHVAGYNVLLFHLLGRPVVLLRRFDPAAVLGVIGEGRATLLSLAPTMISMLLEHPDLPGTDLSPLRAVWYGASGIPGEVLKRGMERLGCSFEQGYGMTELSGNAAFLDGDAHRRAVTTDPQLLAAAGRPGPLVSLRVVDDALAEVPAGEVGEIVIRGDQVTAGYWRDDDATADAFKGGWFHTGDLGRFDEEGFLSVVDRKKDVIVTGGENVSSREVEDVLHGHPAVLEVAVVGVPDEHWGEAVCAVVVVRDGHASDPGDLVDQLMALCKDRLAGFKKPRLVVFWDELPKNSSGKVQKQVLREELAAG